MAVSTRYKTVKDKDGKPILGADGKLKRTITGYQASVSVYDPKVGKTIRRVVGTFRRSGDAHRAERAAKVAVENGRFELEQSTPTKVSTVADCVSTWLAGKRATVSANTASQYESAWRLHLEPALGDRDITRLSRVDVKAALRTWQQAGMKAQLQNRVMLVLRGALDEALENGLVAVNPATGITLPSTKKRRDIPHWTPAHLRAFLAEGEQDQLGVFWHFTALEGMRRAEGLALRWSDLHWSADDAAARATIVQTIVPDASNGGAPLVQPRAKTKGSQRTVTLSAPTVAALKRHRDRQAFQRQKLGDVWPVDYDLIVTNDLGGPVRPDSVRTHRLAVVGRAGVPDPGTHGLRHHAATAMLRAGVSPAIVAQKIGHSDISLTVGTYGHLVPADQAPANAALESLLAEALPTGTE